MEEVTSNHCKRLKREYTGCLPTWQLSCGQATTTSGRKQTQTYPSSFG